MKISSMIILLFTLMSSQSFAQSIRILQVKGKQAIVELTDVKEAEKGKSYSLAAAPAGKVVKDKILELAGSIENNSTKTGDTTVSGLILDLTTRWGLNKIKNEYGILFNYAMDQRTNSKYSSLGAGLFFDYNMIPNNSGVPKAYGFGAEGKMGMVKVGSSADISFYSVYPYGFYKWFINSNNVAINAKLGYEIVSMKTTPQIDESNIKLNFGLSYYY